MRPVRPQFQQDWNDDFVTTKYLPRTQRHSAVCRLLSIGEYAAFTLVTLGPFLLEIPTTRCQSDIGFFRGPITT